MLALSLQSKHAFRIDYNIGSTFPAYAAATGKALLSELTEAEIDSLYPHEKLQQITKKTIATKTELKLELEQIRKVGVAFNKEGRYEGVEAISSVIRDVNCKAVAAISIAAPIVRLDDTKHERIAELIRLGARLISHRLGCQNAGKPILEIKEICSWWEQNQ
ncbi:HTH-type transcriptional repressor AllR [subsurface metagenome]